MPDTPHVHYDHRGFNRALALSQPAYTNIGDYDGDGMDELRYYEQSNGSTVAKVRLSKSGKALLINELYHLTDQQYLDVNYECDPSQDLDCITRYTVSANAFTGEMDYNLDGLQDVVYIDSNRQVTIALTRPRDDAGVPLSPTIPAPVRPVTAGGSPLSGACTLEKGAMQYGFKQCKSYVTDLNGDGIADLLVATGATGHYTTTGYVRQVDGNGQPLNTFSAIFTVPGGISGFELTDLDGDGKQDLVSVRHLTWYRLGTGTAPVLQTLPFKQDIVTTGNVRGLSVLSKMADFNGDGLNDFMTLSRASAALNTSPEPDHLSWHIAINKGNGGFENLVETRHLENVGSYHGDYGRGEDSLIAYLQPFDFNNDGRTDFLVPHSDRYQYECYRNTGIYIDPCYDHDEVFTHYHRDIWSWKVWQASDSGTDFTEILLGESGHDVIGSLSLTTLVDVNFDGVPDITTAVGKDDITRRYEWENFMPEGHYVYTRHGDEYRNKLLKSVTTDMAKQLEVDYSPLRGSDLYQVDNTVSQFPYVNFGSSMVVVSGLKTNNGLGGENR